MQLPSGPNAPGKAPNHIHTTLRWGRAPGKPSLADESTATATYTRFTAEPFEIGYARTIGNSLRRVLLSSIEGAAISAVKIKDVSHEFSTIKGCAEDVTDITQEAGKVAWNSHLFKNFPQLVVISVAKGFSIK